MLVLLPSSQCFLSLRVTKHPRLVCDDDDNDDDDDDDNDDEYLAPDSWVLFCLVRPERERDRRRG